MELDKDRKITVMAHRGYAGKYPENTMLAFKRAWKTGCDAIELDVHVSKDGELVIMHDETVNRTTGGSGQIRNMTLEELKGLNAAAHFTGTLPPGIQGCSIPTLLEYLTWAKNKPFYTNIELKDNKYYYTGIERKVLDMVKQLGMSNRVILSSFNHASLMHAKEFAPAIRMGALCERPIGNAGTYVKMCGLQFLHPNMLKLNARTVKECHKKGILVNVWTPDTREEMLAMLELGVDGLITDQPKRALNLLAELRGERPPKPAASAAEAGTEAAAGEAGAAAAEAGAGTAPGREQIVIGLPVVPTPEEAKDPEFAGMEAPEPDHPVNPEGPSVPEPEAGPSAPDVPDDGETNAE